MSPIDYKEQRLSRNEARKHTLKIMNTYPGNVLVSRHATEELANDNLTTTDVLNVLKSPDARIHQDGDWKNGSYRYRIETSNLMVVVGFWKDGRGLNIVTAWDKRKGRLGKW